MSQKQEKSIDDLINDPKFGLHGTTKMYQKIRHKIKNQEAIQIYKDEFKRDIRKKFQKIDAKGPFVSVQFDLADFPNLKHPKNQNVRYLLVAIDVYSRYCWIEPLNTRHSLDIESGMKKIFSEMKRVFGKIPQNITTDNEFENKVVKKLAIQHRFNRYTADPNEKFKTGMVERLIRTIRNLIKRYVRAHNTIEYVKVLPDLVYNYNHTPHRSIGITPTEAIEMKKGRKMSKEYHNIQPHSDIIGKTVRLRKPRSVLDKGDKPKFTVELYEVVDRISNRYRVRNIKSGKIMDKLYGFTQLLVVEGIDQVISSKKAQMSSKEEEIKTKEQKDEDFEVTEVSSSEDIENEKNEKNKKTLSDIIARRAELRKQKLQSEQVEPPKSRSSSPENVDQIIEKRRKHNQYKRRMKRAGLDDQMHKRVVDEDKKTIYDQNLEKIKSKREAICNVCGETIHKGQTTFNNSKKDIDVCEDCMTKHLRENAYKDNNLKNIDGIIVRRSKRNRKKPLRYR